MLYYLYVIVHIIEQYRNKGEKMKSMRLNSYAKINLALDVLGKLENGYHRVSMIMHLIELHDTVLMRWYPDRKASEGEDFTVEIKTNRYYLPTDERNIAWKAAVEMKRRYGAGKRGRFRIDIKKEIPVAAGLAGGSSNCAAVILGLNSLWNLDLSLKELMETGAALGSDVPFAIAGLAAVSEELPEKIRNDSMACVCALAEGTGTDLTPLPCVESNVLVSKPAVSVSTKEVYQGLDLDAVRCHPDMDRMVEAIRKGKRNIISEEMVNVLETYTCRAYPQVSMTEEIMRNETEKGTVLMSGSGPTVFSIFSDSDEIDRAYEKLSEINKETVRTRTMK